MNFRVGAGCWYTLMVLVAGLISPLAVLAADTTGSSGAMVNPGPTDTDLMAGLPKKMLRPVSDSVADMIRNIDYLTPENSGRVINADGSIVPW